MKKIFAAVFYFIPKILCAQMNVEHWIAPASPALFTEVNINTALRERDFALSPDGTELFYTLQAPKANFQTIIYVKKDATGKWGAPEVAPFSGWFTDLEPAFTMDGKRLFFVSNRPVMGTNLKDFDIWYVDKQGNEWGEPRNVGTPVNGPSNEFYPSIGANGNLYFTCNYKNSTGGENIYVSIFKNGKYSEPVRLDDGVNSEADEFNAFVTPDEQIIIFSSYGRKDDKGGGDLYMSRKNSSGQWTPAKNLEMLNSERLDYCPFVSFDGKSFFFTSERSQVTSHEKPATYFQLVKEYSSLLNGGGNIYWVSFDELLKYLN